MTYQSATLIHTHWSVCVFMVRVKSHLDQVLYTVDSPSRLTFWMPYCLLTRDNYNFFFFRQTSRSFGDTTTDTATWCRPGGQWRPEIGKMILLLIPSRRGLSRVCLRTGCSDGLATRRRDRCLMQQCNAITWGFAGFLLFSFKLGCSHTRYRAHPWGSPYLVPLLNVQKSVSLRIYGEWCCRYEIQTWVPLLV